MVLVQFYFAGDVASFDELAFRRKLANNVFAGTPPEDVDLLVFGASVRVQADIITPNASVAAIGMQILAERSMMDLSSLLGQTVESATVLNVITVRVAAPSPPPPSAPPPPVLPPEESTTVSGFGSASGADALTVGLAISGAALAALLAAGVAYACGLRRGRHLRSIPVAQTVINSVCRDKGGRVPTDDCEAKSDSSLSVPSARARPWEASSAGMELPHFPNHPDPDCCTTTASTSAGQPTASGPGRLAIRHASASSPRACGRDSRV